MSTYLSYRDGGKTDEEGISRHVGKFFAGEVIDGLTVGQQDPVALGVTIQPGDAMIPSGSDYPYIGWSDDEIDLSLATADGSNPRYDLIVAYVDLSVVDDTNPNNPDAFLIDNVTGTPSGTPSDPNEAAIEAVIGASNPYIILARVTVGTGATTITNSNVENISTPASVNVATTETLAGGWVDVDATLSVASGYNNGNKSFTLDSSADLTGVLSPGMRFKATRSVTPPDQCFDAESSSSHYASKSSPSGITFTDDFTCEAWIKLESYALGGIVARRNADTEGWSLGVEATGQVSINSLRIVGNNRTITSSQSLPLNKWVHIAATMDNSANTHTMYIDGVAVPTSTITNGTITSIVQGTTALVVGARKSAGTDPFDGKIDDVRLWSTVRNATQIRDNMNQALVGNESNLVAYFKLDGDFTDETSNSNDLTAQNGAAATNNDHPFAATEYGIITSVSASEITVQCPEGHSIPNETLSNPFYSTQSVPFGFPRDEGRWEIITDMTAGYSSGASPSGWQDTKFEITLPVGKWRAGYLCGLQAARGAAGAIGMAVTLSQSSSTEDDNGFTSFSYTSSATAFLFTPICEKIISVTSATKYYLLLAPENNSTYTFVRVDATASRRNRGKIYATCAYL